MQALAITPELAYITLDDICETKVADDSLQPVIQALLDQVQPPHKDICQYPEEARVLLSQ